MKYLMIFLLVFSMMFFIGCFVTPEDEPGPILVVDIVCEGGYYVYYSLPWATTDCENPFSAGAYWVNDNGRVFFLGDVPFTGCPTEYIVEIFP